MRSVRPARLTRPFSVLVAMTAVVYVLSRIPAMEWMVVLVSGLVATLVLSAVVPALALSGVRMALRGPRDATVGRPATFDLETGGRVWGAILRLAEPRGRWSRLDRTGTSRLTATPARRGVFGQVRVELQSAAPLGLVWWRRVVTLPLDPALEVGPVPVAADLPRPAGVDRWAEPSRAGPAGSGSELPRGVREYVTGDSPRLVSWPASARHGRLLVRDMEAENANLTRLTVVVDLRGEEAAVERAASQAAGLANAALSEGIEVVMATAEREGPRTARVTSPREVGRRLARATGDGPPPEPREAPVVRVAAQADPGT